jgi:hypothetical protein
MFEIWSQVRYNIITLHMVAISFGTTNIFSIIIRHATNVLRQPVNIITLRSTILKRVEQGYNGRSLTLLIRFTTSTLRSTTILNHNKIPYWS